MLLKFVLGLGSRVRAPSLVERSYNCVLNVVVTSTTDDMRPSPCWLICLHACLFAALKGLPHGREVVAEAATFNVSWRHAKFAVKEPPSSLKKQSAHRSFFPLKGCLQNGAVSKTGFASIRVMHTESSRPPVKYGVQSSAGCRVHHRRTLIDRGSESARTEMDKLLIAGFGCHNNYFLV